MFKLTVITLLETIRRAVTRDMEPAHARVVTITRRHPQTHEEINTVPQPLQNDVISVLPVKFTNLAGQVVDAPHGGAQSVSLVDSAGVPSALGTVAIDAEGNIEVAPAPGALGDATIKYDDMSDNAGTPKDISFTFDVTFSADDAATAAHVDVAGITTKPAA